MTQYVQYTPLHLGTPVLLTLQHYWIVLLLALRGCSIEDIAHLCLAHKTNILVCVYIGKCMYDAMCDQSTYKGKQKLDFPSQGSSPGSYITGGHVWVVLCAVEAQEVASTVHDTQGHTDLVCFLAVDGQLDVTGHSQSMVHTQHPLVDVNCSLLEVEGLKKRGRREEVQTKRYHL